MKKSCLTVLLLLAVSSLIGCQPTIATISVTESIAPNGDKTVTTRKTLSQVVSHTQTSSTDQIIEKYR